VKTFRPLTPSTRYITYADFSDITKSRPEKSLVFIRKKTGGRNAHGRVTARAIGGGHKQKIRSVDFRRNKLGVAAKVVAVEYDPIRSARLALLEYADGERRYILAPKGLKEGDEVQSGQESPIKPGNAMLLRHIPVGSSVHNIELKPGKGGQLARSAGASAQYTAREGLHALIRLRSGEMRKVHIDCRATIGEVGNEEHSLRTIGKAGATRWRGIRPTVRGISMNPVDHPHGGGEGKTSGGRHPVTPWGQPTRGYKTRNNKRTDKFIVNRRSK